ncbi:M48 family metallopeptidase [Streptomyces sp. FIT100]|uniref:M48 family metallopeptidase n=1 Tax=Streptomyces sp. FIT100 TaxID=2837956 RepID=UPI0021CA2A39|nr:M48 family metallopeptidase [Streptomyces sp. FIT100]UUN28857.1 M48 family metallopeptidase [Streptomyces sp. FIT100]
MGTTLRAFRAVVLLAGFYLLGVLMLALLAAIDWAATLWTPGSVYLKLYVVSVVLAVPIVRGMFMLRAPKDDGLAGLGVTETDEPRLWATVRELADQVGTRAPAEIVLTADVNAAVTENARFLGLLPGRRRLYLGLPLMQGLSEGQLKAVLAHELGHFSNSDTRLAALTWRGRTQVMRTIAHFEERSDTSRAKEQERQEKKNAKATAKGRKAKEVDTGTAGITYRTMAKIYTAYAKFFFRATRAASRRQEYAADAAAARIAGRDATAAALREIPALDAAHGFYMDRYATLGAGARLLPPRGEVFGGFGRMLSARELELMPMRSELPTEPASPYDSHPPIADRVRRIEELPDDGRTDEARGAALGLLTDPERTLVALEEAVLLPGVLAFRRTAGWQELLDGSMSAQLSTLDTPVHRALAMYTKEHPTLPALLKVIDDGHLWQLAQRLPLSDEAAAASGRVFREFVRPSLRKGVSSMALAELGAHDRLGWEFSWSDAATVHLPKNPDGTEADLEAAVDAAIADTPDTAPLRALLSPVREG